MKLSIGIEYALHCLLYMIDIKENETVGIKDLATFQGVSESYLAKVFAKLSKAQIVKSVPGVKGGYTLCKTPENITFLDVVEAIEGKEPIFKCAEIRQNTLLLDKNNLPKIYTDCPCTIKIVMLEAEEKMKNYLNTKTLAWLHSHVDTILTKEQKEKTIAWFENRKK
ncbi:RrF2 family transcriptional regulator [Sarcina ventriculi]|uniref:HTH-type transcriptional regulator iscR n=1 Tax=Sarcina ventriculi TaxID=1267 RepID=A0ABM9UPP3_SARVE|nr:Rrf2 family transcriptional regulator [Sarcina ventriculi]CUN70515.1 HTH-type transcriptional regulator iscR [Sarcina ventriculi]